MTPYTLAYDKARFYHAPFPACSLILLENRDRELAYSIRGCSLASGHILNGKKMIHVCSFCLFNNSAAHNHAEAHCRNKMHSTTGTNIH